MPTLQKRSSWIRTPAERRRRWPGIIMGLYRERIKILPRNWTRKIKSVENTSVLGKYKRVQVPPRAPITRNQQSVEIAGFSFIINGFHHFRCLQFYTFVRVFILEYRKSGRKFGHEIGHDICHGLICLCQKTK